MSSEKEVCKQYMEKLFGPISSKVIDYMSEEEAIEHCVKKIDGIFGEKLKKEFEKELKNSKENALY